MWSVLDIGDIAYWSDVTLTYSTGMAHVLSGNILKSMQRNLADWTRVYLLTYFRPFFNAGWLC